VPKHAAIRAPKPLTPHDRRVPINRAPSPQNLINLRNLIQTRVLITRLQDFAKDDPDNPRSARLTRTQAMVGLALLRKVLPDMQALEISGNSEAPITVQVLRFSDAPQIDGQYQQVTSVDQLAQVEANPRLIEDEPTAPDAKGTSAKRGKSKA